MFSYYQLILLSLYDLGAVKIFKKLNIDFLDFGDYLGIMYIRLLYTHTRICIFVLLDSNNFFFLSFIRNSAIGAIFAATDSVCTLQVLNIMIYEPTYSIRWRHIIAENKFYFMQQVLSQDETPLLYSLVFGEGVVNDATSVVLFNAIQSFDMTSFDPKIGLHFIGNFFYLFISSTFLGVAVSPSPD